MEPTPGGPPPLLEDFSDDGREKVQGLGAFLRIFSITLKYLFLDWPCLVQYSITSRVTSQNWWLGTVQSGPTGREFWPLVAWSLLMLLILGFTAMLLYILLVMC